MILTIDIGNTNIMLCIFTNNRIINSLKINTISLDQFDILKYINNFREGDKNINVIISSVVPDKTDYFIKVFKLHKINYFYVTDLVKFCKLKTNIKNRKSIGDDRLINVIFAKELYYHSTIVIDFGTATTIDILDNEGIYDGGVITPGIDLSLESLQKGTAKLPLVSFKKTKRVVGRNTSEAIRSGFFWGYVSMIKGLVRMIENEKKYKFKIILTGGNSKFFKGCFRNIIKVDDFFNAKGLNFVINEYFKQLL